MKKVCLVNGSLRGRKASSLVFLNTINGLLDESEYEKSVVTVKAIRVIRNFCRRLDLSWRFAVSLGGGPIFVAALKLPMLRGTVISKFKRIAADIETGGDGPMPTLFGKPFIPKPVVIFIREHLMRKKG